MLCVRRTPQMQAVESENVNLNQNVNARFNRGALSRIFQPTSAIRASDDRVNLLRVRSQSQSQPQISQFVGGNRRCSAENEKLAEDRRADTPQRRVVYLKIVFNNSPSVPPTIRIRSNQTLASIHGAAAEDSRNEKTDYPTTGQESAREVRKSFDVSTQSINMAASEYEELKEIGRGSYGTVWLIRHKVDNKKFVQKKIDLKQASTKDRKSAEQESKLLSQLKHPNIVSYRDSYEKDGMLHIIMGFCEGGDLYNLLQKEYKLKQILVEERQIVQWLIQIAMALEYLHDRNILHRDLKTQNIFLTKQSQVIKVGDLGIARVLNNNEDMAKTFTGTPYYMSPELFAQKPYNHKSDVWAFGICVYEMATLDHAFNAKDLNSLAIKVVRGKMPAMPTQYSPELVNLIKAMLHREPEKRPSILRILKDPFIRRNIQMFLDCAKQQQADTDVPRNANDAPAKPKTPSQSAAPRSRVAAAPAAPAPNPTPVAAVQPAKQVTPRNERDYQAANGYVKARPAAADAPAYERRPSAVAAAPVKQPTPSALAGVGADRMKARAAEKESHHDHNSAPSAVRVERVEKTPALVPVSERAEVNKPASVLLLGGGAAAVAAPAPREREVAEKDRHVVAPSAVAGQRSAFGTDNNSNKVDPQPSAVSHHRRETPPSPIPVSAKVSDSSESPFSEISSADKDKVQMERNEAARARRRRGLAANSPRPGTAETPRPSTAGAVASPVAVPVPAHASEGNRSPTGRRLTRIRSLDVNSSAPLNNNQPVIQSHVPTVVTSGGLSDITDEKKGHKRMSSDTNVQRKVSATENVPVQSSSNGAAEVPAIFSVLKNLRLQHPNVVAANCTPNEAAAGVLPSKMQISVQKPVVVPNEPARKQVDGDASARARQKSSTSSSADSNIEEEETRSDQRVVPTAKSTDVTPSGARGAGAEAGNINNPRSILREQKRASREVKHLINALECTVRVLGDETMLFKPSKKAEAFVVEKTESKAKVSQNHHEPAPQRDINKKPDTPAAVKEIEIKENVEEEKAGPVAEETIGRTGRMVQRFGELRKEIMRAIGYEKLKQAYEILDRIEEEEVEPKLVELLGRSTYDDYIGKIWQLKFCEEALYGHS